MTPTICTISSILITLRTFLPLYYGSITKRYSKFIQTAKNRWYCLLPVIIIVDWLYHYKHCINQCYKVTIEIIIIEIVYKTCHVIAKHVLLSYRNKRNKTNVSNRYRFIGTSSLKITDLLCRLVPLRQWYRPPVIHNRLYNWVPLFWYHN